MKIKKYLNPINYINKIRRPLILKKFRRQNKNTDFTIDSYKTKNCIELKGDKWKKDKRNIIRPNLTDKIPNSPYRQFEKIFDFVKWLNEK